ncbi:MAG: 23S rRNA (uracil(1939)-C(5))-methyltransferase RlmD [bacterium]
MSANINNECDITIESLSFGGMGLGRVNGQVVFVSHTAPGDRVRTRIVAQETDYLVGTLEEIIEPSPLRVEPPCPHFGVCGGCHWQHLDYQGQLRQKEFLLQEAFTRIGHLDASSVKPCIPSPSPFHYRHRMQFNINHKERKPHIGLYMRKTHNLVDIRECVIAHHAINTILDKAWEWVNGTDDKHLHGLDVTVDMAGETALVVLRYIKGSLEEKQGDFLALQRLCPQIKGGLIRIETYKKPLAGAVGEQNIELVYENMTFTIGPETFIQVNLKGNEILIAHVVAAMPPETEKVLELHCGMGNFSIPISRHTQSLFGIESNPEPYRYALINAHNNRRPNCHFLKKSDVRGIRQLINSGIDFSVMVMDPPRSGCKEILDSIPSLGPRRIIYVSCNPSTLARDVSVLVKEQGYRVDSVQPIDMFPQTYHVESVTVLSKT